MKEDLKVVGKELEEVGLELLQIGWPILAIFGLCFILSAFGF
jgi:hypothetical protein